MMEKPLAVSREVALAIEKAAQAGKIHALVNYEHLIPKRSMICEQLHARWRRTHRQSKSLVSGECTAKPR